MNDINALKLYEINILALISHSPSFSFRRPASVPMLFQFEFSASRTDSASTPAVGAAASQNISNRAFELDEVVAVLAVGARP
jgi:hypothetical protein